MSSFRAFVVPMGLAVLMIGPITACDPTLPPAPEESPVAYPATDAVLRPGLGAGAPGLPAQNEARVRRGFELAPVPLDLTGNNPALVGLGSYLAHVHACTGCHTWPNFAPGGNPYLGQPEQVNVEGYMAGGRPFGPFVSRNITPRANGLPGGLTLDEFVLVMRTGIDLEEKHPEISPLLQVMPWPYTSHMTDSELHAIYEYLRAIPCRMRADQSPDRCG